MQMDIERMIYEASFQVDSMSFIQVDSWCYLVASIGHRWPRQTIGMSCSGALSDCLRLLVPMASAMHTVQSSKGDNCLFSFYSWWYHIGTGQIFQILATCWRPRYTCKLTMHFVVVVVVVALCAASRRNYLLDIHSTHANWLDAWIVGLIIKVMQFRYINDNKSYANVWSVCMLWLGRSDAPHTGASQWLAWDQSGQSCSWLLFVWHNCDNIFSIWHVLFSLPAVNWNRKLKTKVQIAAL